MSDQTNQVAQRSKDVIENAKTKIKALQESGGLMIPKDYSVENAITQAMIIISETKDRNNKPALEVCTPASIGSAILKMVVWGLSPLKKQCDFIVYGNELSCSPEYTGLEAMAKRYGGLESMEAEVVYKDDIFEYSIDPSTGTKKVTRHEQKLENTDGDIIGAYAVYKLKDGRTNTEIMTIFKIRKAWNQGAAKGNSPAHQNFPDQMAKKTVRARACKLIFRTSDDSVLFDDNEPEQRESPIKSEVRQQIEAKAHTKTLEMPVKQEVKEDPKPEPVKEPEQVAMQMEEKAPFE